MEMHPAGRAANGQMDTMQRPSQGEQEVEAAQAPAYMVFVLHTEFVVHAKLKIQI
jgi:hypothetical protein